MTTPMRALGAFAGTLVALVGCTASVVSLQPTHAPVSAAPQDAGAWSLRSDTVAGAQAAGLRLASMANMGKMDAHFHVHVDVIANGQPVLVPGNVGVEVSSGAMTDLHTHDTSGVVHVEAMGKRAYTLGQLFTEWGITLDETHLGPHTVDASHPLAVYVDGHRVQRPADLVLKNHQAIAVVYGALGPSALPSTFDFGSQ